MIPKLAIEKAIEGGWGPIKDVPVKWLVSEVRNSTAIFPYARGGNLEAPLAIIALDPLFWQALGRERGWEEQPYLCKGCQTIGVRGANHMNACPIKMRHGSWKDEAHRFYDLILTGQPTEAFWEELLGGDTSEIEPS